MMRAPDVLEHLHAQPFEPFKLCLSDGTTFEIRHPDLCMVARSSVYVGIPDPDLRGAALRVVHCALGHITRIEPIDGEAGPHTSGADTPGT